MSTELKKALRALHNVIVREKQPKRLIETACTLLVDVGGYHSAWLITGGERPDSWASAGWGDGGAPFATVLEGGRWPPCKQWLEGSNHGLLVLSPRAECGRCALCATSHTLVIPLQLGSASLGLFGLSSLQPMQVDDGDEELLLDCAGNLAFALDAARIDAERQRVEQELRESRERFWSAFHSSPYAITLTRADDGSLAEMNEGFVELTGYTAAEALGKTTLDLRLWVNEAERTGVVASLERGEPVTRREFQFRMKDGRLKTGLFSANLLRIGRQVFVLSSIDDVTVRRQAQEEILRLNAELEGRVRERTAKLERSNKELEAFSYSISHDLRAPLRAIDGFTRVLSTEHASGLSEEGQRICSIVCRSVEKMGRLIDDLLMFSRIGRSEMRPNPIDMGAMAASVFEELTTPQSRQRIDFELGPLPPALGDAALLRQTWANLLDNAIKFTSKRERAVISVSGVVGPGENLYTVRDNGAGFEMDYVGKLFGVFQRLHSDRDFQGTGVGLAIVERIVSRHGGRVWAKGVTDRGSEFGFALPQSLPAGDA